MGLAFAVVLSEAVLRSLRLRLAFRYRGPYYLLLVLLFCYPLLLGKLSKLGVDGGMPWFVALFPVVGGLALLTLFPAARIGHKPQLPPGHPWRWPAYPWSLFVVLLVAMAPRTYSFSMGFESGQFRQSSFQPFFLLPLFFAAAILFLEIGIAAKNPVACNLALVAPLGLLVLALPGCAPNPVAARFLAELSGRLGSPIQLTAAALAAFYAIAWIRRLPLGEAGLIACLAILAVVDSRTINLATTSPPQWLPLGTVALVEFCQRTVVSHIMAGNAGFGVWNGRGFPSRLDGSRGFLSRYRAGGFHRAGRIAARSGLRRCVGPIHAAPRLAADPVARSDRGLQRRGEPRDSAALDAGDLSGMPCSARIGVLVSHAGSAAIHRRDDFAGGVGEHAGPLALSRFGRIPACRRPAVAGLGLRRTRGRRCS